MKQTKKMAISIHPLLMAIFSLFFLCLSNESFAYKFTQDYKQGFYWRSFPIQLTRYASTQEEAYTLNWVIDQAIQKWEGAVGKDIWDASTTVISNNFQGNYIRWSNNFGEETGYDPARTLAITIRYNQGTYFERTVIILNGQMDVLRQNYLGQLEKTILHELGHTIGLDHSDFQGAIMYRTLGQVNYVSNDDVAGATRAIDEMLSKQETGYQSPYSTREEVAGCGSIQDISKGGGSGGSGMMNFLLSLILGMAVVVFGKKQNLRQI